MRQGTVLFIVGEGALRAFYNRVFAAAVMLGIPPEEVGRLPIFATEGPVNLGRWDGVQALEFREAAFRAQETAGPIASFFVDTVSRCVPGRENDSEVFGGFLGTLDALRPELSGCDVVAIHHSNADGERERGHSVLGGAVDGNLQLVPGIPDPDGRVPLSLYALKLKEAESGPGRPPVERLLAVKTMILDADGEPMRDEMGLPRTTRTITAAGPEDTTAEDSSDAALLDAIPGEGISASKLCGIVNRGKGTVLRDLSRLAGRGRLWQVGSGKTSRWVRA